MPAVPMSFRAIADDMAARITAGEYQPGDRLPTYAEMAAMYSVSPSTSAKAYALLTDRGMVVGAAGRGVFVRTDD